MFISSLQVQDARAEWGYPFTVPALLNLRGLCFDAPVTLLTGDNGSGKTTVMEVLAHLTAPQRLGQRQSKVPNLDAHPGAVKLIRRFAPKRAFFFSAEDFIKYLEWVEAEAGFARDALSEIDPSRGYAAALESQPYHRTLYELDILAGGLNIRSHGEGFLGFFKNRLKPKGLYLMDEPEGALSYENQYLLAVMIQEAIKQGCQFIIATHSPVITALPDARLYLINSEGAQEKAYEDLPNVQFLKLFMQRREAFFKDE